MGWLAVAVVLAACGGVPTAPQRGPIAHAWSYEFALDEGLSRLEATVCFEGEVPEDLVPIDPIGRRYLRWADGLVRPPAPLDTGPGAALSVDAVDAVRVDAGLDAAPVDARPVAGSPGAPVVALSVGAPAVVGSVDEVPLDHEGPSVRMVGLPPDSCVRYVVDLDAAARQRGGIHGAYRIGSDLVASTAVWLWAPRNRAVDARVTARFELPEGLRVSPLWMRTADGGRRLDERAFRFTAYAAFGRFPIRHVGVAGACLHVSVLGAGVEMGPEALTESLGASATAAAMMFGRFPAREAGILAVPTPFSSSSPFGIVGRGTMPTVAILVGERATRDRLERAWVPVHEFSHLATPFIDREDAWLSEGIATYYQEILRARGGLIRAEEAWSNLDDGFRRGARDGTGRTIAAESRDMMETAAYRRVYWAGAAIALMADVEIRRRTDNRRSLDDTLESLSECCASEARPLSAEEVMRRLDADGPRVFGRVARAQLERRDFPDLARTYDALGLRRTETGVVLEGNAAARALRESIVAARTLDRVPACPP
jgi:hypothetical protein